MTAEGAEMKSIGRYLVDGMIGEGAVPRQRLWPRFEVVI